MKEPRGELRIDLNDKTFEQGFDNAQTRPCSNRGNGAKLRTPCIIGVNDACRVASAIVCIQLADYSADTFRTIHAVDKTGCTSDMEAETVRRSYDIRVNRLLFRPPLSPRSRATFSPNVRT